MKVKIGTVFADTSGNYFIVGLTRHREVALTCIRKKSTHVPFSTGVYYVDSDNLENAYFDLESDFKFTDEVSEAFQMDLCSLSIHELDVSNFIPLEDKDLFVGTLEDEEYESKHTFRIHFPNRVQRLHDNEWATIGYDGEYDFEQLTTEHVFDLIKAHSRRFEYYTFDVPKGINEYKG